MAQEPVLLKPPLENAKHAITFDLGGSAPVFGVSYRHQLTQFDTVRFAFAGAVEASFGIGFIPSICIAGCINGALTTQHSLSVLLGHHLQTELGYAGFLVPKGYLIDKVYAPGALIGLRIAPRTWLLRLHYVGVFGAGGRPGLSVGARF